MSTFDRLMQRADDKLFDVFGDQASYRSPDSLAEQPGVTVIISRNVEVAGADGVFRVVQLLAELRCSEVGSIKGGALIIQERNRYRLDERIRTDGLVEYWSLLPEL